MRDAYERHRRDPRRDSHGREIYELPPPVPVREAVIEGELVDDTPAAAREETGAGADRVVAVAMAVTVTSIAVIGVLNFLSSDPEPEDPDRRKGKRR